MSLLQQITDRIKQVEEAIQHSIFNHSKLLGILEEAKRIYGDLKDAESAVESVIQPTDATTPPADTNPQ